ncbi:PREDICTED: C-C motif chemokine 27 [Dipodomys ordii]|uniref:C-C motif chemokine 27 n=1 Tax=Dipodomys ordii TaxID=10020 RepID=A0A1S3G149_DIPOR|nr:PREDICTED: C-C motif chemokine 27 [Dipodomys ordii]XP_042551372.1 C-C motif chemokine 27 [Dipodomys spectabilis]
MKGFLTTSGLLLLLFLSPDPGTALPLSPSTTCCTQLYRQPLSNKLLRKVIHVELQEADGDCHLQAVVLHLARRSVCIHPQNRSLARWFVRQGKRLQGNLPNLNLTLKRKMDWSPQMPK